LGSLRHAGGARRLCEHAIARKGRAGRGAYPVDRHFRGRDHRHHRQRDNRQLLGEPLKDPRNVLSKRSVYFDLDRYDVKDEYKPLVEAHGKYLQSNRSAKMTIQGNADERGSREYNIALGQRRADTVKRMMQIYGASESQIETVSFGKEKPRNTGHDDAAWAENRRDDIVYAGD
jgi:peptidoglycan-associated lipoprotein